ncbi:MAG: DUF427 domain-containing protein [Acidobacteriaceae bacterium]
MPETLRSFTESVWDYPRPPRLEPTHSYIRVLHSGILLAETTRAIRILETSHPPVFYLPPSDVAIHLLKPSNRPPSFCEFKGLAAFWTLDLTLDPSLNITDPNLALSVECAWSYTQPARPYAALRNHIAFYANRVDECILDGERVIPQASDVYGGWITSQVTGPFKRPSVSQR